jgi:hypothetical protein
VDEYYETLDLEALRARFEKLRDDAAIEVAAGDLLITATLRAPEMRISADKRALGQELHTSLRRKWAAKNPRSSVAAFPPQGVVVLKAETPVGLKINLSPVGAPDFDWTISRVMLNRVDTTSDLAITWLRNDRARMPHIERAYAIATQILGAVQRERWRRQRLGLRSDDAPTDALARELDAIQPQMEEAERHFIADAERNAQNLYVAGMFIGGLLLAVTSLIGAFVFRHYHLSAYIGVAFPGGGLGAVVSVLQRLTSGGLEVSYAASPRRLLVFGAVRPWIGATFGMALFALLQSKVVGTTIEYPNGLGPRIAFFAVLGFLAGFNERFAQDVVSGSSARLGDVMIEPGHGGKDT